jgi:hypothetical protein
MRVLRVWAHEARRVGPLTLLAPTLLVVAVTAGAAFAAHSMTAESVARPLRSVVEMGIPLATAVSIAAVLARDPAVELQLSLPGRYRATVVRRCLIIGGAGAVTAACVGLAARVGDSRAHGIVLGQLTWVAPLFVLSSLALVAAVALRSPIGATAVVAVPWLLELLLPEAVRAHAWSSALFLFASSFGGPGWLVNRFTLLAVGTPLAAAALLLLSRTERLLDGDAE